MNKVALSLVVASSLYSETIILDSIEVKTTREVLDITNFQFMVVVEMI